MNDADANSNTAPPQPFLVALAAWAVPGFGYWVIGERGRGLTVGITVVMLFVGGLLIGGVRALEVPLIDRNGQVLSTDRLSDEIRSKPWSIAQVMTGPVGMVGAYFSAWAARPASPEKLEPRGVESHARLNEIAVLYTAVAGMLNLLAIIDSAHRAGKMLEER